MKRPCTNKPSIQTIMFLWKQQKKTEWLLCYSNGKLHTSTVFGETNSGIYLYIEFIYFLSAFLWMNCVHLMSFVLESFRRKLESHSVISLLHENCQFRCYMQTAVWYPQLWIFFQPSTHPVLNENDNREKTKVTISRRRCPPQPAVRSSMICKSASATTRYLDMYFQNC